MTENKPRSPRALERPASDELLDGILEQAVSAAQRNVEQFAKLASLARAIEQCNSSPAVRANLLFQFEEMASSAEANAKLDVELLLGLRNGQILKHRLHEAHEERAEPRADVTIVAPSTNTKH